MSEDALSDMMAAGAPAISFADASMQNKWVVGTITGIEKIQQTDFVSKKPKFFDEEKQRPMWQYVFTLQTDERDETVEDDDGVRRLYARGQMIGAIKNALKKANVSDTPSALGGKLGIVWTGYGEGKEGLNPPKLYKAKFAAGDATADLAAEPDEPTPAPPGYDDGEEPF